MGTDKGWKKLDSFIVSGIIRSIQISPSIFPYSRGCPIWENCRVFSLASCDFPTKNFLQWPSLLTFLSTTTFSALSKTTLWHGMQPWGVSLTCLPSSHCSSAAAVSMCHWHSPLHLGKDGKFHAAVWNVLKETRLSFILAAYSAQWN